MVKAATVKTLKAARAKPVATPGVAVDPRSAPAEAKPEPALPAAWVPADSRLIIVGLDQLELCDLNVRKTDAELDIEGLADDIAANGLKQNLCVVSLWDPGTATASYGVVAGSRRLRALRLLAARGAIAADHSVPVRVEAAEDGRATSLSENLSRVAMNAADECEAFATVLGTARDPDAMAVCARRFGVTVKKVEERLRLAALAPDILERLRRGTLTLDAAKAYATFADHELQAKVFKAQEKSQSQMKHTPRAIRDAMKGKTYPIGHAWVRYAGTEAYLAEGGRIERSMFMGADDDDALIDTALFEKIAMAKAEAEADMLARAAGFARGMMMKGFTWPGMPAAPEGYRGQWIDPDDIDPERKRTMIGLYKLNQHIADDAARALKIERTVFVPLPPKVGADEDDDPGTETTKNAQSRVDSEAQKAERIERERRFVAVVAFLDETPPWQFAIDDGTAQWGEFDAWDVMEEDGSALVPMMVTIPKAVIDAKLAAIEAASAEPAEPKAA